MTTWRTSWKSTLSRRRVCFFRRRSSFARFRIHRAERARPSDPDHDVTSLPMTASRGEIHLCLTGLHLAHHAPRHTYLCSSRYPCRPFIPPPSSPFALPFIYSFLFPRPGTPAEDVFFHVRPRPGEDGAAPRDGAQRGGVVCCLGVVAPGAASLRDPSTAVVEKRHRPTERAARALDPRAGVERYEPGRAPRRRRRRC